MGHVNEAYDNTSEISGEFGDNVSLSSKSPAAIEVRNYCIMYV